MLRLRKVNEPVDHHSSTGDLGCPSSAVPIRSTAALRAAWLFRASARSRVETQIITWKDKVSYLLISL